MSSSIDTAWTGDLTKRLLRSLSRALYTASKRWPSVARPVLGTILPILARSAVLRAFFRPQIVAFGNVVGYQLLEMAPLFNGMTIEVVRGTLGGESIVSGGVYEIETVRTVQSVVSPGMIFLDVGANVGQYTLIASELVGESGRVYAVEPLPQVSDVLRRNVERNALTNVVVSQLALSDTNKEDHFYVSCPISLGTSSLFRNEYSNGLDVIVSCKTLGTYAQQMQISRIDVMKLDVEGAEFRIIDGSRDMFQGDNAPILLIEFNDCMLRRAGRSTRELLALLQELDYSVYPLEDGLAGGFNALAWPSQRRMPAFVAAQKRELVVAVC